MTEDRGEDGYRGDLNNRCVTIAEVLRSAGYLTAMTGKWHVTKYVSPSDAAQKYNWPLQRGFEHYFGIIQGGADYFRPDPLTSENQHVQPGADFYTTDAFVDNAIRFVDQGDPTKPFFQYIAFNAPHFPLMAPQEEIAKFRGTYKIGWDRVREKRNAKQISLGIVDKAWALSPRPPVVQAWDEVAPAEQDRFDHIMATYAAVVAHMDRSVGRFVEAAPPAQALDNTLILFLSDNGANAESGPNGRLEGKEPGAHSPPSTRANPGPRSPTRPSAATGISTTRGASPRRWSSIGPPGSRRPANSASSRAIWWISWPRAWILPEPRIRASSTASPFCRWKARAFCRRR